MTPLTDSLRHLQRITTRMLGLRIVESRVVGISADAHVLLYTRRGHLRPCVENGSGPPIRSDCQRPSVATVSTRLREAWCGIG